MHTRDTQLNEKKEYIIKSCIRDEKILNKQSYETFGRIKYRIKFSGRAMKKEPQANESEPYSQHTHIQIS